MGTRAPIPSVILSLCFEGAVTQRRALLSVWTQYTSTADVTIAADIDSSGPGPALRAAALIEDQMLKAEARRVFHDWKWGLLCLPRVSEQRQSRTVSCVLYLVSHTWVKWKHWHFYFRNWIRLTNFITFFVFDSSQAAWLQANQVLQTKVTTRWFTGQSFGNLSSHEVRDFGSSVTLNKSNSSPFNFSQESWTQLMSVLWGNNWAWASVWTAVCFARLPDITFQHPSLCCVQSFSCCSCCWPTVDAVSCTEQPSLTAVCEIVTWPVIYWFASSFFPFFQWHYSAYTTMVWHTRAQHSLLRVVARHHL